MKKDKRWQRRMVSTLPFIGAPILFCLFAYFLIYVSVSSVAGSAISLLDMVFLNEKPAIQMDYTNIFDVNMDRPKEGTVKASTIVLPAFGEQFGELSIEGTDIHAKLFFGDSNNELKNGLGVYNGSHVPGYGRTVLIGGHNNTYFHDLGAAKAGSVITIQTNYGVYTYEVTDAKVLKATDTSAYDLNAEEENIVLYTCYPFDALGLTQDRYFVYGKYLSGPQIDIYE